VAADLFDVVLEITVPLLTDAMRLAEIHGLRAYDAVQLAAALELNGRWLAGGLTGITLVSADQDLNIAALAESLMVEDPNLHPSSTPLSADAFDFLPTPAVSNERRRSPVKIFTIELPDDTALPFGDSGDQFARELRLAAAIFWYDRGMISQGKGAEIAGPTRAGFLEALSDAKVDALQITSEELKAELERPLDARR